MSSPDTPKGNGPPRSWTGPLIPLVILILIFAAAEGATRLAVFMVYGDANQAMGESLNYEPYLISLGDGAVLKFPSKQPGTYRILVVGSSTAKQFTDEEIRAAFKSVTEQPVEVINLAQGGYILNQEMVMFSLYGLQMEADLLLTLDGVMDLVAMTKTGQAGIPYMDKRIRQAMNDPSRFALTELFRSSQFVNSIRKLQERKAEKEHLNDEDLVDATVQMFGENLLKFAQISSGADMKYIGVLQPYLFLRAELSEKEKALSGNYKYRSQEMAGSLQAMTASVTWQEFPSGTCFIDATMAFDDEQNKNTQCFLDEAHLSDNGRRLLLEFIVAQASAHGVI